MAGRLPGRLLLRREDSDRAPLIVALLLWVMFDAMPGLWRFIRRSGESGVPDQLRHGQRPR
ncbi:hypothetical protein ACIP95_28985 [Micromonospora parva]|uniref:hypothetical protein n=1 Tax=Micromonospora parva TaxID=1464048 RepID=UPI0004C02064|nr:hypothetical protein [Micromonospora parva]